jgi:hypothetical protein
MSSKIIIKERHVERIRRALLRAVLANGTATIDDVHDVVELPANVSPKTFGAAPSDLVRSGIIRRLRFEKTTRDVAHRRHVSVWILASRTKAEAWLKSHPEPVEDPGSEGDA